jgi:hypothetical protein
MRQQLANLLLLGSLGGCSLLYNPNNLPPIGDANDAQIIHDADPTMLKLTSVTPQIIFEGEGDGSRRAVLAIHGEQIVKDSTTVTLTAHAGSTQTPMLIVDNTQLDVSADGNMLSVPVTLPVDPALLGTQQIRLDVTVTQNTVNGPASFTLSTLDNDVAVLALQGLDELINADATTMLTPMTPPKIYSKIDLTGSVTAATGSTEPLIIRATSSIKIGSAAVNAAGRTGGAAGGTGGAAGPGGIVGGSVGGAGTGPAFGMPSGGVGGFVGMDQITTLDVPNRGSGGAGGNGASLGAAGGAGGGGGGSIEISAGGDLTIGPVDAKGASGTTGANNGGAGSGGVVLLRSGGSVTVSGAGANVSGGAGPGTAGAAGRVRIDAPGTITATTTPSARYRGPTFVPGTPLIVRSETPKLTLIGQPNKPFNYYFTNDDGSISRGPVTVLFPPTGVAEVTLEKPLFRGTNHFCALVEGGSPGTPEAGSCIQIVYLYTP